MKPTDVIPTSGNYFIPFCVLDTWKKLFKLPKGETHHWRDGFLSASCVLCGHTYNPEKHNEAFRISPRKNIYYCFKCHNGGDAYSLVSHHKNLPVSKSREWLKKNKMPILKECTSCGDRVCEQPACIVKFIKEDEPPTCAHTFELKK